MPPCPAQAPPLPARRSLASNSLPPLQTFASRALQGLTALVPLLVALSCLGALNGGFFGAPR